MALESDPQAPYNIKMTTDTYSRHGAHACIGIMFTPGPTSDEATAFMLFLNTMLYHRVYPGIHDQTMLYICVEWARLMCSEERFIEKLRERAKEFGYSTTEWQVNDNENILVRFNK